MNYDYCIIKLYLCVNIRLLESVRLIQISHIDLPLTKLLYAFWNQNQNNKNAKIDNGNHSDHTYNAPHGRWLNISILFKYEYFLKERCRQLNIQN